jgi:hypothetical protein
MTQEAILSLALLFVAGMLCLNLSLQAGTASLQETVHSTLALNTQICATQYCAS